MRRAVPSMSEGSAGTLRGKKLGEARGRTSGTEERKAQFPSRPKQKEKRKEASIETHKRPQVGGRAKKRGTSKRGERSRGYGRKFPANLSDLTGGAGPPQGGGGGRLKEVRQRTASERSPTAILRGYSEPSKLKKRGSPVPSVLLAAEREKS